MPAGAYDVFVSYRRSDAVAVRELVDAMEARGLRVWRDETAIPDFAGATDEARAGIAASRAFLAYYSAAYPRSRPCQWELTEAFVAAQRHGEPTRRVLVVNPEQRWDHIQPVQLADARFLDPGAGSLGTAAAIAAHVGTLDGWLGGGQPARVAWYPVPVAGAPRFVGRLADMWRVHSALFAVDAAMTQATVGAGVAVLRGIGGAGKSLLAQEYALRFATAYPGGVFWLRASSGDADAQGHDRTALEVARHAQVREVARRLLGERAPELDGATPEEVDAILRTEIAGGPRCLWVVDDLPEGLDVDEVARWIGPDPAKTLITTRSGEYGAFHEVVLGMLDRDEAVELLTARRAPTDAAEEAAAADIVEDLGRHPLAVDVAAAAARYQSYAELRDGLRDPTADELELAAKLRDRLPTGHVRSVAATLHRSIRGLGEAAMDVLRLAAVLAAFPIPADLVGDVLAAASELGEREARWRRVEGLDELAAVSLADSAGEDAWTVHELVSRTIVAAEGDAERRHALRTAAARVIAARIEHTPGVQAQVIDLATHAQLVPVLPHARHLVVRADDAETAWLLSLTALYDQASGATASAEELLRRELAANRRLYGDTDVRTVRSITFLAEVLGERGEVEQSLEMHQSALAAFRDRVGDDDPRTLASINLVAGALRRLGRHEEAISWYRRSVDERARVMGGMHRDTLDSMERLAEMLADAGRFAEAGPLAESVVDGRRRTTGDEHPDTLASVATLARILGRAGELESSAELHAAALVGHVGLLGEDHPRTLDSMHDAAMAMLEAGDVDGARDLNAQVLEHRREQLGPDAPKTLSSATNLAEALRRRGELEAARTLIEDTLERSRRTLGDDHPETVTRRNNLAAVLSAAGDHHGACALLEEVLAVQLQRDGEQHPETLQTISSLAATAVYLGEVGRAIELGERAVLGAKHLLGPQHPITVAAFMTLVAALGKCDDAGTVRGVVARVAPHGPGEFVGG